VEEYGHGAPINRFVKVVDEYFEGTVKVRALIDIIKIYSQFHIILQYIKLYSMFFDELLIKPFFIDNNQKKLIHSYIGTHTYSCDA